MHEVRGIPTHSCVLLDDEAAARSFPRGDLELAWCPACDFLFNAAFDPARVDYSEDYEETQGHSPTFSRWLGELAEDLVGRLDLRGGRVVEIGCGRGDFLALLCRAGDCSGVGVDPSGTAGRVDRGAGRGLEFLRAEYGPEHAALGPDLVVCRHTLEHLGDVAGFLRLLRENLDPTPETRVFLEVPDVERQLVEGAFWDFYYEHASYFSIESLAGALARAGFEVEEIRRSYGDQYLQALVRPAAAAAQPPTPRLGPLVAEFRDRCRASLADWNRRLDAARAAGGRVALWGSGSKATGFLTSLAHPEAVDVVVDINPDKHGRHVASAGQRIVAPDELRALDPTLVVIMNPIYRAEIARDLASMGIRPEVLALGA